MQQLQQQKNLVRLMEMFWRDYVCQRPHGGFPNPSPRPPPGNGRCVPPRICLAGRWRHFFLVEVQLADRSPASDDCELVFAVVDAEERISEAVARDARRPDLRIREDWKPLPSSV